MVEYMTFLRTYTLSSFPIQVFLHTPIKRTSGHAVPSQEMVVGTLLSSVHQKQSSAIEAMLRVGFNTFKILTV